MVSSSLICKLSLGAMALAALEVFGPAEAATPTYETWKKSEYYKEAYNKRFLPPSTYKTVATNEARTSDGMFTKSGNTDGESTAVAEEKKRFEQALKDIEELKKLHPHASFSLNTPFALMTEAEFRDYVSRNNINPDIHNSNSTAPPRTEGKPGTSSGAADGGPKTKAAAPGERVDWQDYGCVTPVKDQAQCGACWAFSATAAMESGVCVETRQKSLPDLADQQLISCDNQGQSQGCGGGYASYTMDWIAKSRSGKMCTLSTYPFESSAGNVPGCKMNSCSEIDIGVTGFESIRKDPGALEDKVRERPVSVFLYSGSRAFQYYAGGILTGENCDKSGEHSALAVGFGEENGLLYWRLKNQWGTKWGENGYVRIQRRYSGDSEGACGVELYASWPTFKSNLNVNAPNPNFPPAPAPAPTTAAPTPAPEPITAAPEPTTEAPQPVPAPEPEPTLAPQPEPTVAPTPAPTTAPTTDPSPAPTSAPTAAPTAAPTSAPTAAPTTAPKPVSTTPAPTSAPTSTPSSAPTPVSTTPAPTPARTTPASEPQPEPTTASPIQQVGLPSNTQPEVGSDASMDQCGRLDEGVDYLGNDLKDVSAASAHDCCALCHKTPGCNAFTFTNWKGGHCFMKSRAGIVVPLTGAVSSSLQDLSKYSHQNTPLEVGYDFPGNDLSNEKADSADKCYELCTKSDGCHAFTWTAGACYLKSRKLPAGEFKAGDYASAIVYKCPNLQVNVDFEGDDLSSAPARSPEACCAICKQTSGCKSFSWNDYKTGTCWLKSGAGKRVAKGGVLSATI